MSDAETRQETLRQQHEMSMQSTSHSAGVNAAMSEQQKRLENPQFLKQLQEADVDTELWDWVQDEYGPVFSGAHILGNRDEHYERQQELLNRNKAERMVAEGSPGRLLRENPRMLALAQGISGTPEDPDPLDNPAFREPMTSAEKRVSRDAAEVATTRQTLGIEGRGLDAVANATVENRTLTDKEQEGSSVADRVSKVFE